VHRSLQIIFSVFALLILGLIGWQVVAGTWSPVNSGMLAIAAACCLLVFVRFLYVFNYSYALALMLNALLLMVALRSPAALLLGAIAFAFGLRLFLFCRARQRGESYAPKMEKIIATDRAMPLPVRIPLWLMPTLLYSFHLMAVYHAGLAGRLTPGVLLGAALMLAGLAVEGVADAQKQRVKRMDPRQPVTTGIYRRWRHPNYAGEILFQSGLVVAGIAAATGIVPLLAAVLTPLYIVILMRAEAARLDGEQQARYAGDPAWLAWHRASGSLLPRLGSGQ
jgi:steroid 5-alpha reductase family enzyme